MSEQKAGWFAQPWIGFVAGLIVGILVITLMNVFGFKFNSDNHSDVKPILTSESSARAFLADWSRMRTSVWSIDATFTRQLTDGRLTVSSLHQAQQPPNSIRQTDTSSEVVLNDHHYVCALAPAGSVQLSSCRDNGIVPSFEARAQADINSIANAVVGDRPSYDVSMTTDHCYELYVKPGVDETTAQWGNKAEVCFDASTGAPVRTTVHRADLVDDIHTTSIRPTVAPDEINLPAPVS